MMQKQQTLTKKENKNNLGACLRNGSFVHISLNNVFGQIIIYY